MLVAVEPRGGEVEVTVYSGGAEVKRFRVKRVCTFEWMREGIGDGGCLGAELLPPLLLIEAVKVEVNSEGEAWIETALGEEG
jgi:hypothetical protein